MFEFITQNFMGATVSLVVSGIPVVISGEVLASGCENIIALRQKGGNKIFIAADLIGFVF